MGALYQLARTWFAPPQLSVDDLVAKLIRLILSNLIGNGIKYTAQGSVELSIDGDADGNVIAVKDTGAGIAEDDQARIFQPFEQLGPSDTKAAGGVGLGLALVKKLVRSLGGQIELESRLGAGSTFTVRLPFHVDAARTAPSAGRR